MADEQAREHAGGSEEKRVEISPETSQSQPRCPYCHDDLLSESKISTCELCGTKHHTVCFRDGCTVYGCEGAPNARPMHTSWYRLRVRCPHRPGEGWPQSNSIQIWVLASILPCVIWKYGAREICWALSSMDLLMLLDLICTPGWWRKPWPK